MIKSTVQSEARTCDAPLDIVSRCYRRSDRLSLDLALNVFAIQHSSSKALGNCFWKACDLDNPVTNLSSQKKSQVPDQLYSKSIRRLQNNVMLFYVRARWSGRPDGESGRIRFYFQSKHNTAESSVLWRPPD